MARIDTESCGNKFLLCKTGFMSFQKQLNLQQKWLSDNLIVDIINDMMNTELTKQEFNRAITYHYRNKCDILLLHVPNYFGVYKNSNECKDLCTKDKDCKFAFLNTAKECVSYKSCEETRSSLLIGTTFHIIRFVCWSVI